MARSCLIHSAASIIVLTGCAGAGEGDADPLPFFGNLNVGGAQNTGSAGAGPAGNNGGAASTIGGGGSGQGSQQTGGASNFGSGNGGSGQNGSAGFNGTGNSGGLGSGGSVNGSGGVPGGAGAPGGGGFVSVPVNGGASAAFVCGGNQAFVNPFAGAIGMVVTAPSPNNPGHSFTEGPVWVATLGTLFFSDNVEPEKIWELASPQALATVLLNPSHSNGMALDNDDMLLVADQDANKIVRLNPANGAILGDVVPTGNYRPNDLIRRSDGNLYFTSPETGRGFYRVSPTGALSGPFTQANAANAPNSPNGIVLSLDENTLYVGDVQQSFVSSFRLAPDGAVDTASGAIFADQLNGVVDGMALDCGGNLYVGTANGVQVLDPAGEPLGTLMQGSYSSNCTFGGPDRNTLYATSQGQIKSVTLTVRGLPN
jgi:gluconolactonase